MNKYLFFKTEAPEYWTLTPALARRRTAQREREYACPLSLWERVRVRVSV
jgi:hypothetical protein